VKDIPQVTSTLPDIFTDPKTGTLRLRSFFLEVVDGPDLGQRFEVSGALTLGSGEGATGLLSDRAVSRRHVELRATGDGLSLRDLESKNGTLVNSTRVGNGVLREGDLIRIGRTTLKVRARTENVTVPHRQRAEFGGLVGNSRGMQQLFMLLDRLARTDSTVLIEAESGTGKELVARALHSEGPRASGPFVVVDCGAVNPELIQSDLFGHVRGAFTGAVADRDGAFERASGGTLLLDEIGELPIDLQPSLLRVIESRRVTRVGDTTERPFDVRIIAATNKDLETQSKEGTFRSDLYYRLAVVRVTLPPLRERPEDIPLLTETFLKSLGLPWVNVSEKMLQRFKSYPWPGNVRELRNVVTRSVALGEQEPDPASLSPNAKGSSAANRDSTAWVGKTFKDAKRFIVDDFEKEYLVQLLERHKGNISAAAREAGINRNHIHRLVRRLAIDVPK
jgi:two-component system nitrogen regulation response regulator GlnG